jgi:hypothetical protein
METRRRFSVLVEIALVGAALTGCAVAQPQPEVAPDAPSASSPSSSSPDIAPPPDTGRGSISVELPQLPIGGNVSFDENTLADNCVAVNWIVDQDNAKIPENVQIWIGGAAFTDDVYALADAGCSGENPPCIGFIFDVANQTCALAIAPTGIQPSSPDAPLAVSISGEVTCSDGESFECAKFLSALVTESNLSIPLDTTPPSDAPPADESLGVTTSGPA